MITVAILTRNRIARLKDCLASVTAQLGADDDILVLDTGSTDGTREWLEGSGRPERARFLTVDAASGGFAEARNLAVANSRASGVAFLDDDCIASPGWLDLIREDLRRHDAVGGQVLPGILYDYPFWWSPELAWAIGMSGTSLASRVPGVYPATANFAASSTVLREQPFRGTDAPFTHGSPYLGGREDAQWWADARRSGGDAVVEPRSIVFHFVPPERIAWRAVLGRARTDGQTAWMRHPVSESLPDAARDAWASLLAPLLSPVTSLRHPERAAVSHAWGLRQFAYLNAAGFRGHTRIAGTVCLSVARHRAGKLLAGAARATRPMWRVPDEPHRMLVAAPTYLGDTVLLQPVIRLLATNWPKCEVTVWTRCPDALQGMPANVRLVEDPSPAPDAVLALARSGLDAAFAPYYHFGDGRLWRTELSARGSTFDRETGFRRLRDTGLAARVVRKRHGENELLNLLDLMSLWPLAGELGPPRLTPNVGELANLLNARPELQDGPFAAIQLGSGNPIKDWPADRWGTVAECLMREKGIRPVFVGFDDQGPVADALIASHGLDGALNLCRGVSVARLLALLSKAAVCIGACSGPKHLAIALGRPTYTLYGLTRPEQWGPLYDRHLHAHTVSHVAELTPAESAGLPPNHAMSRITADAVLAGLWDHLKALGDGPSLSRDRLFLLKLGLLLETNTRDSLTG